MIYVIEAVGSGCVKIGYTRSKDIQTRLDHLQIGCPLELIVRYTFKGGRKAERKLQETLGEHRVRGEWFQIAPSEVDSTYSDLYLFEPGFPEYSDIQWVERNRIAKKPKTKEIKIKKIKKDENLQKRKRHPWSQWSNGEIWTAKIGEHFKFATSFASMIYSASKKLGKKATVSISKNGNEVSFQFFDEN